MLKNETNAAPLFIIDQGSKIETRDELVRTVTPQAPIFIIARVRQALQQSGQLTHCRS